MTARPPAATSTPPPDGPRSPFAVPYRALTVGLLAIVVCFAFEAMAVTTAMPVVSADLGGGGAYGLAFSVYLTASLAATVLAGSWCDRAGPRPAMLTGLALMLAGLAAAAVAGDFVVLVLGRAVSGLGGGMMIVAVYVLIGTCLPESAQPRMFGAMSAAWVLPSLVGPLAAGLLAQYASWRLVFAGIVPAVVAAVLLIRHRLVDAPVPVRRDGVRAGPPEAREAMESGGQGRRLVAGLVLAGSVLVLQTAAHETVQARGDGAVLVPGLLTAAAAVATVLALRRLMPGGFFRVRRGLPAVLVARIGLSVGFLGAEAFLPLMLITVAGLDPAVAGLSLAAAAIGWATGAFWQARTRLAPPRLVALSGGLLLGSMAVMAALAVLAVPGPAPDAVPSGAVPSGAVLLATVPGWWAAMIVWAVSGFAMGVGTSVAGVLTLRYSTDTDRGVNAAAMQLSDQLGGVLGTTGAGTLFAVAVVNDAAGSSHATGVYGVMWAVLAVFAALAAVAGLRAGRPDGAGTAPGTGAGTTA